MRGECGSPGLAAMAVRRPPLPSAAVAAVAAVAPVTFRRAGVQTATHASRAAGFTCKSIQAVLMAAHANRAAGIVMIAATCPRGGACGERVELVINDPKGAVRGVGGEQQGGEVQRGQSAESELSSQAADATPSVPVSNEILRGEAGRRHRRAPANAVVARSDVSSDADSDTKNRALEEADEMMQMFAPPKRPTQVRAREGTAVREYVCAPACWLL